MSTVTDNIPASALAAIRTEIAADSAEYRDGIPDGAPWLPVNAGPSPLLSLRVPADLLADLNATAKAEGVPLSAVAREILREGLAARSGDDLAAAIARLESDVATIKRRALPANSVPALP